MNETSHGGGEHARGDLEIEESIKLDLQEVEKDKSGIPTFVFSDELKEGDRPLEAEKTLEVVMLWREAVMSVGHYAEPRAVLVGESAKNDFRVATEGLPRDHFHLLNVVDGRFAVHWTHPMALEVRNGDGFILTQDELIERGTAISQKVASHDVGEHLAHQYVIGLHDRVALQIGEITFVLQYVSPARLVPGSFFKSLDYYFTKVLSLSFLAHAFAVIALLLTPIEPAGLEDDLFKNPNRFAQLILKAPAKKPEPKKFELSGAKSGARHKDDEGKFGKKEAPQKDALASVKGAPKIDPNKREKDRKIALESGIFKALQGDKTGAVSNVLGPGGLGTGINNALGGLRGVAMGDAGGAGGMGTRGSGPGGGGTSLGIGGLGTGTGRGGGGLGNVDLGGRGKAKYEVTEGRTVTKGCLTQDVVLRVLRRVQSQAKYCYEKELTRDPNLAGKVTTSFVIGANGSVVSTRISASTMGSGAVESCLLRVIERLRFPPCAGGGVAEVHYPWIFKSGGQ